MPEALDRVPIRHETKDAFRAIGEEWRMSLTEVADALVANWAQTADDKKVRAIRRPSPTPHHRREKQPA